MRKQSGEGGVIYATAFALACSEIGWEALCLLCLFVRSGIIPLFCFLCYIVVTCIRRVGVHWIKEANIIDEQPKC
jgi:hypothetical protein